jgi:hypothetical protein
VTIIPANDVRIPAAARQALARHEEVLVSSHVPGLDVIDPDLAA